MSTEPNDDPTASIRAARVVLPCAELQPTLDFFVDRLGFRLDRISPADDPRLAEISGHGLRLSLQRDAAETPARIELICDDPSAWGTEPLVCPNGTRIDFVGALPALVVPPVRHELVLSRDGDAGGWVTGRAGMRYRDLIPGRLGGRFVASRIQIPDGGPVPDSVHYHAIRFQMIYCAEGWVRVVYEGQGEPFVLHAGDCVLQPPGIRHRVLESSEGLAVIEISCPAEHDTFLDHTLELPTAVRDPDRTFCGQRFVRHAADAAIWSAWHTDGFECRDLGFCEATGGLARARVVRPSAAAPAAALEHDGELLFVYVLRGSVEIEGAADGVFELGSGDSMTVPAATRLTMRAGNEPLEFLEVRLPGGP